MQEKDALKRIVKLIKEWMGANEEKAVYHPKERGIGVRSTGFRQIRIGCAVKGINSRTAMT